MSRHLALPSDQPMSVALRLLGPPCSLPTRCRSGAGGPAHRATAGHHESAEGAA